MAESKQAGSKERETQDRIVSMVGGRTRFGDEWQKIGNSYTTALPQIVCIGPVGEAKSRLAALIHGSGVSARIGGYGAVFGAKKLKAISVTGTGNIQIADPKGVLDARLWQMTGGGIVTGSFGPAVTWLADQEDSGRIRFEEGRPAEEIIKCSTSPKSTGMQS